MTAMSTPEIGAGNTVPAKQPVEYRRVYVWELPVRVYHWINAVALVTLCVTGYLIGAPIRAFFPLKKSQRQEIVDVVKADVLQTQLHGPISTGHNALAGMIYFLTFLAFLAQTITGFALYSSMSSSWLPRLFTWVVPLLGGDFGVRFWHHLFLWFFVTFAIVHIYLAFYHDYIEGRGTVSSIIGGWKFEREKSDK